MKIKEVDAVYIHLPFCSHICHYCDFPKVLYKEEVADKYLLKLKEEIIARYQGEKIKTLYFGGGSPSALNVNQLGFLKEIMGLFNFSTNPEITMECNVDDLDYEKVKILSYLGINRISLGIQTLNHGLLKQLNRQCTMDNVRCIFKYLKMFKIDNINVDLMYGFTHHKTYQIHQDIKKLIDLGAKHFSIYSLIIEPNTVFYQQKYPRLSEDEDAKMYDFIVEILNYYGFKHYEVSNFAYPGFTSKHNLTYWRNEEYYGFGLASASYLNHQRFTNTRSITKYLEHYEIAEIEEITPLKDLEYEFILGLRQVEGINRFYFQAKQKKDYLNDPTVVLLLQEKKLIFEEGYLKINPQYFYLMNDILINFIH